MSLNLSKPLSNGKNAEDTLVETIYLLNEAGYRFFGILVDLDNAKDSVTVGNIEVVQIVPFLRNLAEVLEKSEKRERVRISGVTQ